jgi:hypothetical protein
MVPVTDCEPAGPCPVARVCGGRLVAAAAGLFEVRAALGDADVVPGLGDGDWLGDGDGVNDGAALVAATTGTTGATDAFAPGPSWPEQATRPAATPSTTTSALPAATRGRRRAAVNRAVRERGSVS